MKKILFVFLVLLATAAKAQQIPLFSQYFHNPFIYNPAWAGLDKFASVNFTHRQQWENIPGAPSTNLATIDLPFYANRCGVGLNWTSEKIGMFTTNRVMFSYAYHIFNLYENSSYFSMGITGGVITNRLDLSNAYILQPGDTRILDNSGDYQGFEMSFGLNYIYKDKFQIGLALPQLFTSGIRSIDQEENNIQWVNHIILTAKCTLKTYDEMHRIEPMVMMRRTTTTPFQFDIGAQYTYNNFLWMNGAFRTNFTVAMSAGFNFKNFRAGYARDFAMSSLQGVAGASNEIMLGYKFNHLKTTTYGARKGYSNTKIKRKIDHPSRPGPVLLPNQMKKNIHLNKNSRKKPTQYKKRKN